MKIISSMKANVFMNMMQVVSIITMLHKGGEIMILLMFSNIEYEVHWVSPNGNDCLLGGSNDIQEINNIAIEQAKELFSNPFETNERKWKFLDSIYIYERGSGNDAMLAETEDIIDGLMSEIDAKIKNRRKVK